MSPEETAASTKYLGDLGYKYPDGKVDPSELKGAYDDLKATGKLDQYLNANKTTSSATPGAQAYSPADLTNGKVYVGMDGGYYDRASGQSVTIPGLTGGSATNPYQTNFQNDQQSLIQQQQQAGRNAISSKFDVLKNQEIQRGQNDVASRNTQLGRVGGSGDVRMSSAAVGFIDAAKANSVKRLNELQQQEAEALAKVDMGAVDQIRQLQKDERDRQDKLDQQRFQRVMDIVNNGFKVTDQQNQQTTLDLNVIKTLGTIPAGQDITVNGKTYKGLGTDVNTQLVQQDVIENGVKVSKVFIVDKQTGQVKGVSNLGQSETTGTTLGNVTNDVGNKFSTRLADEVGHIFGGYYGTDWGQATGQASAILKSEYPNVPADQIDSLIKTRVPNTSDGAIKYRSTSATGTSIPDGTRQQLLDDINAGNSLTDLYNAYPDVSPSLIQSLYILH